tara:strand:- start:38052 stop:39032 length:981 start_codon:yes stop_codon:yes gene_type:complete
MIPKFLTSIPPHLLGRVRDLEMQTASESCNYSINQLLQRTVLLGGKRLRPLLTYLCGNFFGVSPERLDVYAKAIEMVHAASLSHDDVVDGAKTRRGKPSINAESTNKHAVLAGDYLLADVIVELSKQGNLALVKEMSFVIKALAEGEWIQLDAAASRQYSRELIDSVAQMKTASVMSWCSVAPAIVADLPEAVVSYARDFGHHLGLAFQQMDDTLDFSGNSKKDHLLDLENGIINAVLFEWLELNPDLKSRFLKGESASSLWTENNLDKAVSIVEARAKDHLDKCLELIEVMAKEIPRHSDLCEEQIAKAKEPLIEIVHYLGRRTY